MNKIYVTEEGRKLYEDALAILKMQLSDLIRERGEFGVNYSSNYKSGTDYDEGVYRLQCAIREKEDEISRLEIIKKEQSTDGRIGFDDIVTVHFVGTDKIMRVQLTGEMPMVLADEDIAKITRQSPMGSVIFGAKVGDIVSYKVGNRTAPRGNQQTLTLKILSKESEQVMAKPESEPLDN